MRYLPLFALLAACPEPQQACDASAAASVMVTLSAQDGGDVSAATVSFQPEDGEWAACDNFSDTWTCGWEVAGLITLRAEADGYDTIEQEVVVEQGECHVVGESVALILVPETVDCTEEEVPSVLATVVGSSGEALSGVSVRWGYTTAELEPQPCEIRSGDIWQCGAEVAGELEITAIADGHAAEVQLVNVSADACHVITEERTFELDWLPD